MPVAEHDRAVRAHVIDVLVAIDVPDVRALAAREERRVGALGKHQGRLMSVDTAGNNFLCALHQRVTVFECVGFHGTSCAMIFAAVQLASAVEQTVSENPICRREGQPCKRKTGWSHYNSQPSPTPI